MPGCHGGPSTGDADKLGEVGAGCGAGIGAKPGDADGEGKGERNGDGSRNGGGLLVARLDRRRPTKDVDGSGDSVLASSWEVYSGLMAVLVVLAVLRSRWMGLYTPDVGRRAGNDSVGPNGDAVVPIRVLSRMMVVVTGEADAGVKALDTTGGASIAFMPK